MSEILAEPRDRLVDDEVIASLFARDHAIREPVTGFFYGSLSEASTCATIAKVPLVTLAASLADAIDAAKKPGSGVSDTARSLFEETQGEVHDLLARISEYEAWLQAAWDARQ